VRILSFIKKQTTIITLLTVVIIGIITTQNILLSDLGFETSMRSFYNNYLIFKNAHFHLISNQNLYVLYKTIQIDLFKYSPTFALFFGLFAYLPNFLGLFLWNGLNALIFYALWQVKFPLVKNKFWIWAFVLIEFITNIQSSQSNGLMAGLMVLAYVFLERKNVALATLMVVLSIYLKLFGVVTFALFLLYPDKLKAIGYSLLWMVVLFILPLLVISPTDLLEQYQNWFNLLMNDKAVAYSPSVMGWLKTWFNLTPSSGLLTGIGVLLFLVPFVKIKQYANPVFRQLIMASILIWVVIFNHKAESPTFIIAVTGAAIWLFSQKMNRTHLILMVLTVLFTQLSPTDIFPPFVRADYLRPYVIKVFPIILVWIKILYDATFTDLGKEVVG
jgi:hypothetical protein